MSSSTGKKDLRWMRTERHLMSAFASAIRTSPLEKITVTGLAHEAEVNKATFYLHYRDVYELARAYTNMLAGEVVDKVGEAESFFTAPSRFVASLIDALTDEQTEALVTKLADNGLRPYFMDALVCHFNDALQKARPVPEDLRSEVALSFFLHGVMGALGGHRESADKEQLASIIADLLDVLVSHGNAVARLEGIDV